MSITDSGHIVTELNESEEPFYLSKGPKERNACDNGTFFSASLMPV